MRDIEHVRDRIAARFAPGWLDDVAVPDAWLTHLGELDAALAALDPTYQLAQVKEKFGGLRYYLANITAPACCVARDATHPAPVHAGPDSPAWHEWEKASTEHADTVEHQQDVAAAATRDAAMRDLIRTAEHASYTW